MDLVIQSLTNMADKITIRDQYDSSGAPMGVGAIENILADDGDGNIVSRAKLTTDQAKLTALLALYTNFASTMSGATQLPDALTITQTFTDGWSLPPRVLDYSAEGGAIVANLAIGPTPTPAATRMNLGNRDLTPSEISRIPAIIGSPQDDVFTGRDAEKNDIAGGMGDDSIFGLAGVDMLQGDAGDDTIEGGAGADMLDGGAHMNGDLVSYATSSGAVTVDLAANTVTGGDATG